MLVYSATTPSATHCEAGWKASVTQPTPAEVSWLQLLPAGSFSFVVMTGKHACMFRMRVHACSDACACASMFNSEYVGANHQGTC